MQEIEFWDIFHQIQGDSRSWESPEKEDNVYPLLI